MLNAWGAKAIHKGNIRAIWNTPATTIVAAWISALTGVGPSMASGSQMCNGNMAPPINISVSAVGRIRPLVATARLMSPTMNGVVPSPMMTCEP